VVTWLRSSSATTTPNLFGVSGRWRTDSVRQEHLCPRDSGAPPRVQGQPRSCSWGASSATWR